MTDQEEDSSILTTPAAPRASRLSIAPRIGAIALPKTFVALRHRNYRLYFFGQLVSLIGTWMQNVAQAWLVYQLTNSPLYLGIVSFASAVPSLPLSLWAGVVIDRAPKRTLLIATQTALMLLAFILAADVFVGWVQPWHVVILALLLGVVNAFDAPARQAFVVEMVERKDLMNGIALNAAIFNTGRIVGPALAGIALALIGSAWCFFLNGVSFLAVIGGLWLMQVTPHVAVKTGRSQMTLMREGLRYIWHSEVIRTLLSLVAVANIFAFGYSALLPAFAQDVLHSDEVGLGLLSTAVGIGALSGALLIASLGDFSRKGVLLTIGNLLFPIAVLLFSASQNMVLSLVVLVFVGLGFMIQNATANTLIQITVPDELRGRVMSIYMMIFNGLFPIGSLIAGGIAQQFSVPIGAAFGGAVALAFALLLHWRTPFLRKLA